MGSENGGENGVFVQDGKRERLRLLVIMRKKSSKMHKLLSKLHVNRNLYMIK